MNRLLTLLNDWLLGIDLIRFHFKLSFFLVIHLISRNEIFFFIPDLHIFILFIMLWWLVFRIIIHTIIIKFNFFPIGSNSFNYFLFLIHIQISLLERLLYSLYCYISWFLLQLLVFKLLKEILSMIIGWLLSNQLLLSGNDNWGSLIQREDWNRFFQF